MALIKLKKSSTAAAAPTSAVMDYGELAINYADGILYYKDSSNVIKQIGSNATVAGAVLITGDQTIAGTKTFNSTLTLAPAASLAASQPAIDITQTWGNGAVTFTGLKQNITNNSSAVGSLLMDLQVGGSSKFRVDSAGSLKLNGTQNTFGTAIIDFSNSSGFATTSQVSGISGETKNSGAGSIIGINVNATTSYAGTVVSLTSVMGNVRTLHASTVVTDSRGFYALSPIVSAGAITNQYGLYIESQKPTGVTAGYGVYQLGATDINYFAGNVGIGNTAPGEKLQVAGSIKATTGDLILDNNRTVFWGGSTEGITGSQSANSLSLLTSGSTRVFVKSDGNVGIGTTSPGMSLEINSVNQLRLKQSDASGAYFDFISTSSSHGAGLGKFVITRNGGTTSTPPFAIDTSGNVGIGTSTPVALLTVGSTATTSSEMTLLGEYQSSVFNNSNTFNFRHGGADRWRLATNQNTGASNDFDFRINAINAAANGYNTFVTIKGLSGNVGIGTTGPVYKLDVTGTGRFTNTLTLATGTITASQPAIDITQTWYSSGVTFTGLKQNITDTASASGSLLLDLQTGGVSKFSVTKTGGIKSYPLARTVVLIGTFATGANQVAYINLPASVFIGSVEIRIGGRWSNGPAYGSLRRRFNYYKSATDALLTSDYTTEVLDASGPVAINYAIGDLVNYGSTFQLQVPIYQLSSSTTTNTIYAEIIAWSAGTSLTDSSILIDGITVTAPAIVSNSFTRNYVSFSEFVGIATTAPTSLLSIGGTANRVIGMERNITPNTAGSSLTLRASGATIGMVATANLTGATGGTGYAANNMLALATPNGGTASTITVITVDTNGAILTFSITTKGALYTTGVKTTTVLLTNPVGVGTGATINVATIENATDKAGGNLLLTSGIGTGTLGSEIQFWTSPTGTTGATDNAVTQKMTILGNGNVGIGTAAPAYNLHILGTGTIASPTTLSINAPDATTAGDSRILLSQNTSLGDFQLLYAGTDGSPRSDSRTSNNAYIEQTQAINIRTKNNGSAFNSEVLVGGGIFFSTNATGSLAAERMRIDTSGNVGIGTTTPLTRLDVAGSGRFTGSTSSTLTGTADPTASTTLVGTSTLFTTELVIGDRITVNAETRTVTAIASATSLTVDTAFTDTASASITKLPAILLARLSSNAVGMVMNNLGNVGIGTTAPAYTLDVTGTGRFTSTLLVSGATTINSSLTVTGAGVNIGPISGASSGTAQLAIHSPHAGGWNGQTSYLMRTDIKHGFEYTSIYGNTVFPSLFHSYITSTAATSGTVAILCGNNKMLTAAAGSGVYVTSDLWVGEANNSNYTRVYTATANATASSTVAFSSIVAPLVGSLINGVGIIPGTTVTASSTTSVTLSAPHAGITASPYVISYALILTASAGASGQAVITFTTALGIPIYAGAHITGTGISAGTYILTTAQSASTTVTLSTNLTAPGASGTYTLVHARVFTGTAPTGAGIAGNIDWTSFNFGIGVTSPVIYYGSPIFGVGIPAGTTLERTTAGGSNDLIYLTQKLTAAITVSTYVVVNMIPAASITSTGIISGTRLAVTGTSTLYAPSSTNSSTSTSTNWLRSPAGTVTAFIGDTDSTSAYGVDAFSGNLRFNGAGVNWGDFGYYPMGGSSTNWGHFRFSLAGSPVVTTPSAWVSAGVFIAATGFRFSNSAQTAANYLRSDGTNFVSANLAAADLTGTVVTARIAGSYTGITAVGTLTTLAVTGAVDVTGTLSALNTLSIGSVLKQRGVTQFNNSPLTTGTSTVTRSVTQDQTIAAGTNVLYFGYPTVTNIQVNVPSANYTTVTLSRSTLSAVTTGTGNITFAKFIGSVSVSQAVASKTLNFGTGTSGTSGTPGVGTTALTIPLGAGQSLDATTPITGTNIPASTTITTALNSVGVIVMSADSTSTFITTTSGPITFGTPIVAAVSISQTAIATTLIFASSAISALYVGMYVSGTGISVAADNNTSGIAAGAYVYATGTSALVTNNLILADTIVLSVTSQNVTLSSRTSGLVTTGGGAITFITNFGTLFSAPVTANQTVTNTTRLSTAVVASSVNSIGQYIIEYVISDNVTSPVWSLLDYPTNTAVSGPGIPTGSYAIAPASHTLISGTLYYARLTLNNALTANITLGSTLTFSTYQFNTLTFASATGLFQGAIVTGNNIPPNASIFSISSSTVTLSFDGGSTSTTSPLMGLAPTTTSGVITFATISMLGHTTISASVAETGTALVTDSTFLYGNPVSLYNNLNLLQRALGSKLLLNDVTGLVNGTVISGANIASGTTISFISTSGPGLGVTLSTPLLGTVPINSVIYFGGSGVNDKTVRAEWPLNPIDQTDNRIIYLNNTDGLMVGTLMYGYTNGGYTGIVFNTNTDTVSGAAFNSSIWITAVVDHYSITLNVAPALGVSPTAAGWASTSVVATLTPVTLTSGSIISYQPRVAVTASIDINTVATGTTPTLLFSLTSSKNGTNGIYVNSRVFGTNIPYGTIVTSIIPNKSIVLSSTLSSTLDSSVVLTFTTATVAVERIDVSIARNNISWSPTSTNVYRYNSASVLASASSNDSGFVNRITTVWSNAYTSTSAGAIVPGFGGFYISLQSRPSHSYACYMKACIPIGYTVNFTGNSIGNQSTTTYVTDILGTGRWEDYVVYLKTSSPSTTFSSTFYMFLVSSSAGSSTAGGWNPTPMSPLIWHVSSVQAYEMDNRRAKVTGSFGVTALTGSGNTGYIPRLSGSTTVLTNSPLLVNAANIASTLPIAVSNIGGASGGTLTVTTALAVTGATSIQGSALHDLPTYAAEFLSATTWVSTGWTGSFSAGWTHTTGNVTALSYTTTAAVTSTKYQIAWTVTNRTAGSFSIGFGGEILAGISATDAWGPTALSTASLAITPTTDFNGTIVISIKSIIGTSTSLVNLKSSDGIVRIEIRANAATSSANNNTFIGFEAGRYNTTGVNNIAYGYNAFAFNTTGFANTAIGRASLYSNTTGNYNTANGGNSLYYNTTGYYNIAVGYGSLYTNTTGFGNNAVGLNALQSNLTGYYNIAIGTSALQANTTGINNVACGHASLNVNTTGVDNTAIGYASLLSATNSSSNNTVVGANAGRTLTTSNYNTFLGNSAGYHGSQSLTASNSMALGNGTYTTADNQVVIGNTSVTQTLLNGNVGIGTVSPTNILSFGNGAARKFWIENSATDVVGRALTVAAGGTIAGTSVSNVAGGNLILQSGLGTGTGASAIEFQTGTTLTTGLTLQTMSTKMTILGSGNVGIGTATPAYTLDVAGTGRFTGGVASTTAINVASTDANTAYTAAYLGFRPGNAVSATNIEYYWSLQNNAVTAGQSNGIILNDYNGTNYRTYIDCRYNSNAPTIKFGDSIAPGSGTLLAATFNGTLAVVGTITGNSTVQGTRLISTIAAGTAPLTVTSTTAVTNLNADLLDGQEGAYYQNATNLNAGTVATARLGSGTASSTTFLRGDNTWATPAGGSSVGIVPIGTVLSWLKSFNSSAAGNLPATGEFVECNGQALSTSPYTAGNCVYFSSNGTTPTIPNLNGATVGGVVGTKRFLRGFTASGGTGGSESQSHTHTVSDSASTSICVYAGTTVYRVTSPTGSTSVDTLPPYYEVVWIMRVM